MQNSLPLPQKISKNIIFSLSAPKPAMFWRASFSSVLTQNLSEAKMGLWMGKGQEKVEIWVMWIKLISDCYIFINKYKPISVKMIGPPNLSEEQIASELNRLQGIIFEKIGTIKEVIEDEDRWVAEQIAMKKQTSTQLIYPKYDKKVCYYQEFWKIYLINQIMISKIKEYSVSNKMLTKEIDELQETEKQWSQIWNQKIKKKVRRPSSLIVKSFECPFPNCDKTYGTDVSLNLHMKLKHNSGTKTQREALARQIILAEERGDKVDINLTFPPGYMEKFRQSLRKQNL